MIFYQKYESIYLFFIYLLLVVIKYFEGMFMRNTHMILINTFFFFFFKYLLSKQKHKKKLIKVWNVVSTYTLKKHNLLRRFVFLIFLDFSNRKNFVDSVVGRYSFVVFESNLQAIGLLANDSAAGLYIRRPTGQFFFIA